MIVKDIEEFKKYNFEKDESFQKYVENIFPQPSGIVREKIKRKYYKSQINNNFDINYDDFNEKVR
jgi:hypothetical protein